MSEPTLNELQQQAIDALTRQQDAYLQLVREWKRSAGTQSYPTDAMPDFTVPWFADAPSPAEVAAANQRFFTRVAEQQQRFFASLNDILGNK